MKVKRPRRKVSLKLILVVHFNSSNALTWAAEGEGLLTAKHLQSCAHWCLRINFDLSKSLDALSCCCCTVDELNLFPACFFKKTHLTQLCPIKRHPAAPPLQWRSTGWGANADTKSLTTAVTSYVWIQSVTGNGSLFTVLLDLLYLSVKMQTHSVHLNILFLTQAV